MAHWNAAAETIFGFSGGVPPYEKNLLWRLFADPSARARYSSWETTARTALARFRAEFASHPGDARFADLVEDLERESAEFGEWWPLYDVAGEAEGREEVVHPDGGRIILEHTTLSPPGDSDLKVVVYTPASEADADRLARALREEAEDSSNLGENSHKSDGSRRL